MITMQPIEGITPDMLWTALIVLVGLGGLIVLGDKVMDVWRNYKKRKEVNAPGNKLADEISQKVFSKLEPRFTDIDRKFANDKQLLETHTRHIGEINKRVDGLEKGQKAQCHGILALLNHELHNGNSDEMEEAKKGMDNYLIEK